MVDFEADAQERQAGWDGFTKMLTIGTVSVAIVLVLMAVFLL